MGYAQQATLTLAHDGNQELLAAIVRGDERALAALYDQFSTLVLAIALPPLARRRPASASAC